MKRRTRALVVALLTLATVAGTAVASWAPPIRGGGSQPHHQMQPDPKRY